MYQILDIFGNKTPFYLVSPRDWQGVPIPIDNFKVRFRDINKLDEPNHQAMMSLVDDYVRSNAVEQVEPLIKTAADVNDAYLDSKQHMILYAFFIFLAIIK